MEIGKKLTGARVKAGLTQEQVAEAVRVSRQTISNWENERSYPDVVSVIRLSDLYDVNLDELLKGDDGMIRHLDRSTNTVKSNRRLALAGVIVLAILYITFLAEERRRSLDLAGPAGPHAVNVRYLIFSGPVVYKTALMILFAALVGIVVALVRLRKRKGYAGGAPLKQVVRKRDVVCLIVLAAAAVGSFLILW